MDIIVIIVFTKIGKNNNQDMLQFVEYTQIQKNLLYTIMLIKNTEKHIMSTVKIKIANIYKMKTTILIYI